MIDSLKKNTCNSWQLLYASHCVSCSFFPRLEGSELSQVPEGLALLESGLGEIDGVGDRRGGAGVHVGGGDAHGGHEGGGGGGGGVSEGPGVERFSFRL